MTPDISLPTSKQVIASRLNLTPETLSRIFHDLATNGLIAVSGKQITIDNQRLHSPVTSVRANHRLDGIDCAYYVRIHGLTNTNLVEESKKRNTLALK